MTARPPVDETSRQGIPGSGPTGQATRPEWADGLRQLYDSVVDEPLPDSFKDLLSQLDDPDQGPELDDGPKGGRKPE